MFKDNASLAPLVFPQSTAAVADPRGDEPMFLGKHVLGEFLDCESLPDDVDSIREQMEAAARQIGATIVRSVFHRFNPYGLSGVVVISESHLAIHTWPEYRCASVDLFTCSNEIDPRIGFDYLGDVFGARRTEVVELPRGIGVRPSYVLGEAT